MNIIKIFNNSSFIKKIYHVINFKEKIPILGRWCHITIPSCNNDIIMRKIDLANQDNNYKN